MNESSPGSTATGKPCLVADTAAFLAGTHLQTTTPVYTTPRVIQEIRDPHSKHLLQLALQAGKITVQQPPPQAIREARHHAAQTGTTKHLSPTDIEVLALAIHLKKTKTCNPTLATDDYKLQKTTAHAGIPYKPVKTPGLPQHTPKHK